jgi:hypothetical protein
MRVSRVSIRQILIITTYSPVIGTKEMFRKQGNFLSKPGPSIFVKGSKGENILIKDYIT